MARAQSFISICHNWTPQCRVYCPHCIVLCKVQSAQCIVYSVQCIVEIVWCIVHSVQCIVHSVHCILYSAQCAVYSAQCAVYIVQCIVCSIQCIMCSVYCIVYSEQCFCIVLSVQFSALFTESTPLGRLSHIVAMCRCVSVFLFAPLGAVFFSRPLIGPEIRESVTAKKHTKKLDPPSNFFWTALTKK